MRQDELIKLLNRALQFEYNDIFLYMREAKSVIDKKISQIFDEFCLMEMRHADMLAIRILGLGGKPVWEFKLLNDISGLKEILERHLSSEVAAIDAYSKMIEYIDDAEITIVLRGIKAEEEIHRDKLKELIS